MRRVRHPTTGRVYTIGGCRLPKHAPVGLRLKSFMLPLPPASPASVDWSAKAMPVLEDAEGNLTIGDCVIAEDAHYIAVMTGNANTLFPYTDAMTIADYSAITGYNPNDPSTDQGTDPTVDLNYRVQKGYADGSKDAGWMLVDASNQAEVKYALSEFGNLKLWFGIPDSIANNPPNASGFVWDVSAGNADQSNGHCIGSCGYNPGQIAAVDMTAQGVLVMTWGMLGLVTWAALAAWFVPAQGGGAAVRVTQDWVSKASGKTPAGLDAAAMIGAFNTYFGGNLVVPAPPQPAPTTPPTLAQAQAAVSAAFASAPQDDSVMTPTTAAGVANAALAPLWPPS